MNMDIMIKRILCPYVISSMGVLVYGDASGCRVAHLTMIGHGRLPNKVIDLSCINLTPGDFYLIYFLYHWHKVVIHKVYFMLIIIYSNDEFSCLP